MGRTRQLPPGEIGRPGKLRNRGGNERNGEGRRRLSVDRPNSHEQTKVTCPVLHKHENFCWIPLTHQNRQSIKTERVSLKDVVQPLRPAATTRIVSVPISHLTRFRTMLSVTPLQGSRFKVPHSMLGSTFSHNCAPSVRESIKPAPDLRAVGYEDEASVRGERTRIGSPETGSRGRKERGGGLKRVATRG